ncbi:unnamed protein product [Diabrotica balteata]|uniref:Uncharacterized protein n=1 Tax=Diabrotica balteata TaxID=107213 RepID=A0A9N9TCH3_DIABA|nr:unnamed protein product [Diabrotica balteata]
MKNRNLSGCRPILTGYNENAGLSAYNNKIYKNNNKRSLTNEILNKEQIVTTENASIGELFSNDTLISLREDEQMNTDLVREYMDIHDSHNEGNLIIINDERSTEDLKEVDQVDVNDYRVIQNSHDEDNFIINGERSYEVFQELDNLDININDVHNENNLNESIKRTLPAAGQTKLTPSTSKRVPQVTFSGIEVEVDERSFYGGKARFLCEVTVFDLYKRQKEIEVEEDRPRPRPSSVLGNRDTSAVNMDMENLLTEIPTYSLYGKNKYRLPPVDPTISDGSDISDDEEPVLKSIQKPVSLQLSDESDSDRSILEYEKHIQ